MLKHYMTILYIMRNYHLKYIAYYTITILFVGQVLNNFNAIHFLKYATQHNKTEHTQRRYVITNLMILFMFKYNFEKQKQKQTKTHYNTI